MMRAPPDTFSRVVLMLRGSVTRTTSSPGNSRSSRRADILRYFRSCRAGLWESAPPLNQLVAHDAVLFQEPVDTACDLAIVSFQRKMTRIEHVCLDVLQIATVGRSTRSREDNVILPPDNQRGRLELTEKLLKGRVEGNIGAVVIKQIELNLGVAWPIQTELVQHPGGGVQKACIVRAILVLPLGGLEVHQESNSFTILGSRLIPVFFDGIPELQKTFVVRVAVLHNECLN